MKLKIGIIGAGAIVEAVHLPVLKNIDRIEVAWIFDRNKERMNLLAKMYSVPALGQPVHDALSEIDICLLAIPYGVRKEFIETCAKYGKAVYVEKPFAVSLEEHISYSDLFPPYKIAVGFQRRCYSINSRLRKIVESKVFGQLNGIKFTQGNFLLKGGGSHLSDAKISGGGVIIESAIHILDQILMVSNAEDVSVNSVKSLSKNGIDYDSLFQSKISMDRRQVDVACEVTTLRNLHNGVQLVFDNATVSSGMGIDAQAYLHVEQASAVPEWLVVDNDPASTPASVDQSFYIFWNKFLDALAEHQPNFTNAIASRLTSKWIDGIYKFINN